jgi:hypothetical protein
MMNRSVMQRQMFKNGGPVRMQMGGDPMMEALQQQAPVDQGVASMMPPEAMPPEAMPPEAMPPEAMPTAPGPSAGDIDEASVAQMLTDVAPNFADPEEAEDFETMMNSVRGDEASVEQRRMELASLVGEEDAMKTPESVLALVQPIVQMSLVDQGIGGTRRTRDARTRRRCYGRRDYVDDGGLIWP